MVSDGINNNLVKEIKIVDKNYDNSKMSNEDFLKVLLTDLQWQDPLEAKDISEFINNTVKLREMEILNDFQKTIDLLKSVNESNALLYGSSLIGKKIFYEGNLTYVKDGKSTIQFRLKDDADFVNIVIMDSKGQIVEKETFKNVKGNKDMTFKIENDNLSDGYYTVYIEAQKNGEKIETVVYSQALVESILREDGKIKAVFGNNKVDIDAIVQIGG
ncbi:MAG: flagellar hook capping protein [Aquificae bacterium]|nr:flagellar hook capping protein [Aquificota bacterium]